MRLLDTMRRGGGDTQPNVKRFFRVSGCSFRSFFGIEGLSGFDHSADDSEESVGDASECAGVLVASASQRLAICLGDGVVLDGDHGPVAGGVDQPPVRGESSLDQDGPP